ncbi:hypothetical protein K7432_009571 [Basidiobolus ranarum]|uniref:Rhodanese domain-containing protein n=1 Tax=Basidiobolus ranarum TaxID=34480 RepID=A0ABR2VWW4_9FUNG
MMTTQLPKKNPTSKERVLRQYCLKNFLKSHETGDNIWYCCDTRFSNLPEYHKHVKLEHAEELEMSYKVELDKRLANKNKRDIFTQRRAVKGTSDTITIGCSCGQSDGPPLGTVILFYKYYNLKNPSEEVQIQQEITKRLELTGKIRIAEEGINATLAGNSSNILEYIEFMCNHEMLSEDKLKYDQDEDIDIVEKRNTFFKPSPGCSHVFDDLSVKLVEEICPFGVKNWTPKTLYNTDKYGKVSPEHFHRLIEQLVIREPEMDQTIPKKEDVVLLDVRNYYESRIGHFTNASCPPLRKFSSFPEYIQKNKSHFQGKTILTYCTGGIRCEKASAYLREAIEDPNGETQEVWMLDGGINNYLEWVKSQDNKIQSLFQGKNYVFDARQGIALPSHESNTIVSNCQFCECKEDKYIKCNGEGCHLLIVACDECQERLKHVIFCCDSCRKMSSLSQHENLTQKKKRTLCECELNRHKLLGY